ncbi:hypothetical protein BGZ91_009400 [Linnemannia elongata]|nr:hypothetical protein BGZ91_009400 [Linnemannia elongata]
MAVQSIPIPPSTSGKAPRWTQPVSFYGQSVFSKYYAQSICVFLLLVPFLISPAAAQGQGAIGGQNCVTNYNPSDNVDYFPSKINGKRNEPASEVARGIGSGVVDYESVLLEQWN